MIALSNGTSKYSLNLSQADGARGVAEAAERADAPTTGAAAGGPEEDAILLSI